MNNVSASPFFSSARSDSACINAPTIADCNRGFLRIQLKSFDEAWEDFQAASQKNINFHEARLDEAASHARSKRPLRAARCYFAAFAASPRRQAAFAGLVQSLRRASPYNDRYIWSNPMLQTAVRLGRPDANWLLELDFSIENSINPCYERDFCATLGETTMGSTSTLSSSHANWPSSPLAARAEVGGPLTQSASDAFEATVLPAARGAENAPAQPLAPAQPPAPVPNPAPAPAELAVQRRPHRKALLTTAVVGTALLAPLCGCGQRAAVNVVFYGALAGLAVGLEIMAAKHLERPEERPLATMVNRIASTIVSGDTQDDATLERIYRPWQNAEEKVANFAHTQQTRAVGFLMTLRTRAANFLRTQEDRRWYRAVAPTLSRCRDLCTRGVSRGRDVCVAGAKTVQSWCGRAWPSIKRRWNEAAARAD